MSAKADHFQTIAAEATGEFKDRGSKFLAFAYPVQSEEECLQLIENQRKIHFKANHHCFAWRLGTDGQRHRASDDGEPSGTAGRPILAQIDARSLTDVLVVVVRYFGGTLLGTAGLINAYRQAAAAALGEAKILEKIVCDIFQLDFDYSQMPDLMQAVKKLNLKILTENYGERGQLQIALRQSHAEDLLLKLKASFLKISLDEAAVRDFPDGFLIEKIGLRDFVTF